MTAPERALELLEQTEWWMERLAKPQRVTQATDT